jgi:hypothetical protein
MNTCLFGDKHCDFGNLFIAFYHLKPKVLISKICDHLLDKENLRISLNGNLFLIFIFVNSKFRA